MRRSTRPVTRGLLLAAALLLGILPGRVAAHGALKRLEPAAGARLTIPPDRVVLEFTEAVETRFVRVTLRDSGGRTIERPRLTFSDDRKTVTVEDSSLASLRGAVQVRWSIAGADGHPVEGTFGIWVDAPPPVAPPAPVPPVVTPTASAGEGAGPAAATVHWGRVDGPVATILRWSHYVALLALIGAWCASAIIGPIARRTAHESAVELDGPTRRFGGAAAWGLGGELLLRAFAQADALDVGLISEASAMIFATAWGRGWLLALAGLAVWSYEYRSGTRNARAIAGALIAMALGTAAMGHASAAPTPWAALTTSTAHLLGAGVWIGSLGWLVVVAIPATRARGDTRAAIVRAFSPVALTGAALLAASGAVNAWRYVGSIGALTDSSYGRVLLAKLSVLAFVAGTGFYNWRVIVPRIETDGGGRRLRWTSLVEITIALVVLAVTARLVVLAPPALRPP